MPLQKVNRGTTEVWPCALTALQCHLPSVPTLVDGQCHLAGKTVVYSSKPGTEWKSWSEKEENGDSRNLGKHTGQRMATQRCVWEQSEGEGWPARSSRMKKDFAPGIKTLLGSGLQLLPLQCLKMLGTRTSDRNQNKASLEAFQWPGRSFWVLLKWQQNRRW